MKIVEVAHKYVKQMKKKKHNFVFVKKEKENTKSQHILCLNFIDFFYKLYM